MLFEPGLLSRDYFRLPWQHFRSRDVISGPSLAPMHDRARPSPNPSVPVPKNSLTVKPVTWTKYGSLIG